MWSQLAGMGSPLTDHRSHISSSRIRFGHDRPIHSTGVVEDSTNSSDHGVFHDAGARLNDAAGVWWTRPIQYGVESYGGRADVWGAVVPWCPVAARQCERAKADGRRAMIALDSS